MTSSLSGDEIELAVTNYYLRVDGPYGPMPLSFVDATGPEISKALDIHSHEDAVATFVDSFSADAVLEVFRNGAGSARQNRGDHPGYFRFLVFSCLVASYSEEADDDDFRHRLAEMLGVQSVGNLPGLARTWERLRDWCAAATRRESFRTIVLPDPGRMTQIGYTRRITFPSGPDARRMERMFSGHADAPTPAKVIKAVEDGIDRRRWSEGFRGAYDDFRGRVTKNHRLLSGHAFWVAVTRIWSIRHETYPHHTTIWIESDIDGENVAWIESDDPRVKRALRVPAFTAAIDAETVRADIPMMTIPDVIAEAKSGSVAGYSQSVEEGILIFEESGWGWRAVRVPDTARVRLLLRRDIARRCGIPPGDGIWTLTKALRADLGLEIASTVRRAAPDNTSVVTPRMTEGIHVGNAYLGLSCCLPKLLASPDATIEVEPQERVTATLGVDLVDESVIRFDCDAPLDGRWRLRVQESGIPIADVVVAFVRESNEHDLAPPDPARWCEERETEIPATARSAGPDDDFVSREGGGRKILALAEAVYAGGEKGWAERDLLPLVMQATRSDGVSPWDACRVLADAGWIEAKLSNWWRERRWFLRPPRLLEIDERTIVLDGAACASIRRRFCASAERTGGYLLRGGGGDWQLPLWAVRGARAKDLEEEVGISLAPATSNLPPPTRPMDFVASGYTSIGRSVAGAWDWGAGRFRSEADVLSELPRLERLQHNENRSCDVYRVTNAKHSTILGSRTTAILSAHQLARRALFRFDESRSTLTRTANDGSLPSALATFLRLRHLAGPAIVVTAGASTFEYPAARSDAASVASWLGAAVDGALPAGASRKRALVRAVLTNRGTPNADRLASLWAGRA